MIEHARINDVETVAPRRVILERTNGLESDTDRFCSGVLTGFTATVAVVEIDGAVHAFSRNDGSWMRGPTLGCVDHVIQDVRSVDDYIFLRGHDPAPPATASTVTDRLVAAGQFRQQ